MEVSQKKAGKVARKRKFREQKYKSAMGSQSRGQGFADQKKQKMIYEYRKLMRKEERKNAAGHGTQTQQYEDDESSEEKDSTKKRKKKAGKMSVFYKSEMEAKNKQEEKVRRKEELAKREKAKAEALERYQTHKKKQHKMLARKTFRGQPNMASRIELLLSKIEADHKS